MARYEDIVRAIEAAKLDARIRKRLNEIHLTEMDMSGAYMLYHLFYELKSYIGFPDSDKDNKWMFKKQTASNVEEFVLRRANLQQGNIHRAMAIVGVECTIQAWFASQRQWIELHLHADLDESNQEVWNLSSDGKPIAVLDPTNRQWAEDACKRLSDLLLEKAHQVA